MDNRCQHRRPQGSFCAGESPSSRWVAGLGVLLSAVVLAAACGGSSSNTATAPTSTTRCAVTLRAQAPSATAGGGTGTATIAVNRECPWEASTDVPWLTVATPRAGQGDATVTYTVANNPEPQVRRGHLIVNDARVEISQTGAACSFSLDSAVGTVGAEGGRLQVSVSGLSGCPWTAVSQADWIRVVAGTSGNASGPVTLEVAANTGEPRTGVVVIAGVPYTVGQGAAPAPTPPLAGCVYTVQPPTLTLPGSGGAATLSVGTGPTCSWTVTTPAVWLTVAAPATRQGPGTVSVNSGPNPETAARTSTIAVAGQVVLVVQDAAPPATPPVTTPPPATTCTFAVVAPTQPIPAGGGGTIISVTAPSGCAWTATSTVDWLLVLGGAALNGSGTVSISVTANPGNSARTGNVVVAGQSITLTQDAAATQPPPPTTCTFTVAPQSQDVPAAGGPQQVIVTASTPTCSWTATSAAPWITVTTGAQGTGSGAVSYQVAANETQGARAGTLVVAGITVTITQAAPPGPPPPTACTFAVAPQSQAVGADGGAQQITVTASSPTCSWTTASNVPWISLTSAAQVTGSGTASYAVSAHDSTTSRSGTLSVAGQTVTVVQEGATAPTPCTYQLTPTSLTLPAAGGEAMARLETATTCAWTATSQAPWIAITSAQSGTGSADIRLSAAANPDTTSRTGTIAVGGQVLQVTQPGGQPPPPDVVRFEGRVAMLDGTCPNVAFKVTGQEVIVNGATVYEAGTCGLLSNGGLVGGEGIRQPNGSVVATRIRVTN